MAKLVFDIETSALPLDRFDDVQKEYLFRDAERIPDLEQRAARRCEIQHLLSLWPLTAQIVCIAMMNAETERGQVLYVAEEAGAPADENAPVKFVACMDEAELLAGFWDVAKRYEARCYPHFNLGRVYEHQHDWQKAKECYAQAYALDKSYVAALTGLRRLRAAFN